MLIVRRMERDGARYFGPFTASWAVQQTLQTLRRVFPYLTCNRTITGQDERACLYLDIGLCLGPCIGAASKEEYRAMIDGLCHFLEGKVGRDRGRPGGQDAGRRRRSGILSRRPSTATNWTPSSGSSSGRRSSRRPWPTRTSSPLPGPTATPACRSFSSATAGSSAASILCWMARPRRRIAEIVTSFVKQFYDEAAYVPPEILLPHEIDEALVIQEWLRSRRGNKVVLKVPRRGQKRDWSRWRPRMPPRP